MKWIKNLLHRHRWTAIARTKGKARMWTLIGGDIGKQDIILCVDRCPCGKERAYMSSYMGDQDVGLAYAKGVLNLQ